MPSAAVPPPAYRFAAARAYSGRPAMTSLRLFVEALVLYVGLPLLFDRLTFGIGRSLYLGSTRGAVGGPWR